jgi:hypothetical protein
VPYSRIIGTAARAHAQLRWTEAERRARAAEARRDASLGAAAVARSEAARDWAGARAMLEAEAAEGRAASVEARALRAELARARADLKVKVRDCLTGRLTNNELTPH